MLQGTFTQQAAALKLASDKFIRELDQRTAMDTSNLKSGDAVHVKATVLHLLEDSEFIYVALQTGGSFMIPLTMITHIEPRPIAVGDAVLLESHRLPGRVIAIHGDRAWVQFDEPVACGFDKDDLVPLKNLIRWVP